MQFFCGHFNKIHVIVESTNSNNDCLSLSNMGAISDVLAIVMNLEEQRLIICSMLKFMTP